MWSTACGKATPTILASQGKLADVQRALSEVERSGLRKAIKDADDIARFEIAMAQSWRAYELAVRATAFASDACTAPDVAGHIKLISDAWSVIRGFLSLFGGKACVVDVSDPMVWEGYSK